MSDDWIQFVGMGCGVLISLAMTVGMFIGAVYIVKWIW